jgi:uncharacterized membrane protein YcaP (DUF421 family)
MKLLYLTTELIIGFFVLFIIVKLVGKKIINQISPFTFIAAVVLGELLGNALYDEKIGVFYITYSVILWGLMLILVEYFSLKFLWFRGIAIGKPSALIENGQINWKELKKNRLNLNQLQSLLRQSETFSIREVAYCYLETNGSISILKKTKYQKTTQEDFNLPVKVVYVPTTLIRDGQLLKDELKDIGFTEDWLNKQLYSQGIQTHKEVLLAEWKKDEGLYIQTY